MKRVQKERAAHTREREEPEGITAKAADTEALSSEMDAILEEIDSVLESNAEEFVAGFIQKGGQ